VSDTEAAQDHFDEQCSPEAPRDDYEEEEEEEEEGEQVLATVNSITEEISTVQNGVGEGNHNSEGGEGVESEGSDVEETITPQVAEIGGREEIEEDTNTVKLIEEQQGATIAHHSDEDDRESVSGSTEPTENDNGGM
jgi:hypothetical protein